MMEDYMTPETAIEGKEKSNLVKGTKTKVQTTSINSIREAPMVPQNRGPETTNTDILQDRLQQDAGYQDKMHK